MVLLSIDMLCTCIQAWIPATINAWAKKSAESYHSSQKLICAGRPDQTQILTRSTWFNYYKHVKTRKTKLCVVKTDCCCQIKMLYWFSLLLHMRTERAFKVLELMLCNMNGPYNWVKRTRKPTLMRWGEKWSTHPAVSLEPKAGWQRETQAPPSSFHWDTIPYRNRQFKKCQMQKKFNFSLDQLFHCLTQQFTEKHQTEASFCKWLSPLWWVVFTLVMNLFTFNFLPAV